MQQKKKKNPDRVTRKNEGKFIDFNSPLSIIDKFT
jgi:hypothetical protein